MTDKRIQVTITLDPDTLGWMDNEIQSKRFANRSHAIEYCLHQERTKNQKSKISGEQGNVECPVSA